ncbi:MAG: hypothetical protein J0L92_01830 [Deltaproteobacteria bacterium]|nr:hypothetical protein [Deltaproteobacteria bacterium]
MTRGRLALLFALGLSVPALGVGLAVRTIEHTRLEASARALAEARVASAARTIEAARDAARRGTDALCSDDASTSLGLISPSRDPEVDRARARLSRMRAHGLDLADAFVLGARDRLGDFVASSHARGRQPYTAPVSLASLEHGALVALSSPHEGLASHAIVTSCRADGFVVVGGVAVDLDDPRLSGVTFAEDAPSSVVSLPTEITGARRVVAEQAGGASEMSRTVALGAFGGLFVLGLVIGLFVAPRAGEDSAGTSDPGEVEREVREAAAKLSRGDFDVQLHAGADATQNAFNQMTKELSRARARAVKAERIAAWRDIARRIAHEIKNPLTPIKMSIETMRKTFSRQHPDFPEIFDESTKTVLEEVERMEKIVTEFSRFARLPRPNASRISPLEPAVHVVSMHEVQNVGSTNPDTPRGPRVKLEIDPAFEGSPESRFVRADREQITQVLMNLVQNAIDAAVSKRGPEGANVLVRVLPGERGAAILEVHDDGPGIPEDERPRIFEPYYTTKAHGTGLGLPICDRIVSDHGGTLVVDESPLLGGARFVVTLSREGPLDEADASQTV